MWGYVATGILTFLSVSAVVMVVMLYHAQSLRFAHGDLLFMLLFLPILAALIILKRKRRIRLIRRLGHPDHVLPLLSAEDRGRRLFANACLLSGVLFSLLALLGPQMGTRLETVHRKGVDIFLALDTSRSMDAEDIRPSRIRRAKMEIQEFLDVLEGDRAGLIAFAGDSFIQCPLTLDYAAVRIFLDVTDTSLIPVPGTDIGRAIAKSLEGFSKRERKHKVLILFTDGEDHGGQAEELAKKAAEDGVVIYTIGIGSPEGSIIPLKDDRGGIREYKKDEEGKVVTSRLDETLLQKIALETGGKYFRSTTGEMELKRIYGEIQKMEKKELGSAQFTRYENRYQYFLLPGFLLILAAALCDLQRREP